MTNTVVRARIDEQAKEEATAVLAKDKALPFEPLVPNAETVEAMKAARRGEMVTVGPVDDLLTSLVADD
jgi:DNA-damage-inducible protein J